MLVVLGNRHTWPPFLAFFCLYAAAGNLFLWVVPYLRDVYGLSAGDAALVATAPSLALLVSGPLTGWLSDRVWRRRKLPYALLAAAYGAFWVVFAATLGVLPLGAVYALFFGMGLVGGGFVLTWPIGREVNPPHLAGVAVAVAVGSGVTGTTSGTETGCPGAKVEILTATTRIAAATVIASTLIKARCVA